MFEGGFGRTLCGLQALGHLEDRETVIQEDVDSETGLYLIGRDAGGLIRGVSSDSLHALYFLNPGLCLLRCCRLPRPHLVVLASQRTSLRHCFVTWMKPPAHWKRILGT